MQSHTPSSGTVAHPYNSLDLLGIYTFYRIILGAILLLMFQLRIDEKLFGGDAPTLFYWTSLGYASINIVFLLWMWRTRFQPSMPVLFGSLMIDAAAYMLLIAASGGALSSLSYLLLVAIAAGGIMLRRPLANLQAAITCIAIMAETLYRQLEHSNNQLMLAAILLGGLAFAISLLFQHLSHKVQQSHQAALSHAAQVSQLQELAHSVIERMHTGVLVVDAQQRVSLMNHAAESLLNVNFNPDLPLPVERIKPLRVSYAKWRAQQALVAGLRQHQFSTDTLTIHFTELNPQTSTDTIIFIEDIRALQQHAQQLKLASLGRLTASIAHEIRNPLGALSHAAQLLAECDYLASHDARLLQIIHTQTTRVNSIVENVLHLSRRKASHPTRISLYQWLEKFIEDYQTQQNAKGEFEDPCHIELIVTHHNTQALHAYWDESQLRQVITNLCDNAMRHTRPRDGVSFRIAIGHEPHRQQPFIRIIDFGEGVTENNRLNLFEPFFTTESTGSGLGLYICRELCEANQAFISYYQTHDGHSCFDIQLSHPQRAAFSQSHSIITTATS